MSNKKIWYGFLQAGDKSTPVVRDDSLESKNPKMMYLFNHARGQFLEYSREIVEPKLRPLEEQDIDKSELEKYFKEARKAFSSNTPEPLKERAPAKPKKVIDPEIDESLPDEDDDDFLDDMVLD